MGGLVDKIRLISTTIHVYMPVGIIVVLCMVKMSDGRHLFRTLHRYEEQGGWGLTLSTLSNFNGLFHSLFWIKLKWSVGVKGLSK